MQRYFVDSLKENYVYIMGDDRHHIGNVMRYRQGDEIICIHEGKSALCEIEEITGEQVIARIVKWDETNNELPIKITIGSGLPKGDKLEWIIQKGTELGAAEFIPFTAARSIVKWDGKKIDKKVERFQKIAKEAAEQSNRQVIPKIYPPVSFKELIHLGEKYDYRLVAYEEDGKEGSFHVFPELLGKIKNGQSLLVVFGPEGGFSNEEITLFRQHDFVTCGLGPRILRTETAPLYVLAAVSYHTELLR